MVRFLFWNAHGGRLESLVAEAARRHRVDVIVLAESNGMPPRRMLQALNADRRKRRFRFHIGQCRAIRVYSRLSEDSIQPIIEDGSVSIRRLTSQERDEILLVALHFPSKLWKQDHDQTQLCFRIAEYIRDAEVQVRHHRTVVVGDFNMNPFEHGVVGSEGFHAVSSRDVAQRKVRQVSGRQRRMFYNPMWSRYGDREGQTPGTFYRRDSKPVAYFWNMFDQVLVSADLLDRFPDRGLRVLTSIGGTSLLDSKGKPDKRHASDHLPIIFTLEL